MPPRARSPRSLTVRRRSAPVSEVPPAGVGRPLSQFIATIYQKTPPRLFGRIPVVATTLKEARILARARAEAELPLPHPFEVWISPAPGTESLEQFLARIRPRLLRIASQNHIPTDDVEDMVQETLLLFVEKAAQVHDPEPWIVGTLAKRCLNFRRSRRSTWEKLDALTTLHVSEPTPHPAQVSGPYDARLDVEALMRRLSPRQRQVLRLRYVLGYKAEEIATAMGYHAVSVRKVARRGLERIAILLQLNALGRP